MRRLGRVGHTERSGRRLSAATSARHEGSCQSLSRLPGRFAGPLAARRDARRAAGQRRRAGGARHAVAWRAGRRRPPAPVARQPARAAAAPLASAARLRAGAAGMDGQRGCSLPAAAPLRHSRRSSHGGLRRAARAGRAAPRCRRALLQRAARGRLRRARGLRQRQRERRRAERKRPRHHHEPAAGAPQARRTAHHARSPAPGLRVLALYTARCDPGCAPAPLSPEKAHPTLLLFGMCS